MVKRLWVLINCKINKILSLLSIMIFIVALSCADARTFTKEELANFILNCEEKVTNTPLTNETIQKVTNRLGQLQTLADLTSQYEGYYAFGYSWYQHYFWFVYVTGSNDNMLNNNAMYYRMDQVNINNTARQAYWLNKLQSSVTFHTYNFNLLNDTYTIDNSYNTSKTTFKFGSSFDYALLYTDYRILVNSSSVGPIIPAGSVYPNETIFNEKYISSIPFDFEPITNYKCIISGDSSNSEVYVINKTFAKTLFGTFADSSYLDYIYYNIRAYQSGEGWQDILIKTYDCSNNKVSNYFYTYTQNDIQYTDIKFDSNSIPENTAITLIFSPNTIDFQEKAYLFFIKNDKTVINNGVIDIQATINNDSNYTNNVNTSIENAQNNDNSNNLQDIVNELTDNSEVNGIVNEYFGTSGDLLNKLGYVSYGNPYVDTFYNILLTIKNVLLSNETITYDIYVANTYWGTLSSADFTTSGPLRVFVQALCIFLVVRFILKLFYSSFENLVEGDIKPIVNFFKGKAALITKFF